jgi:hypothetical protein
MLELLALERMMDWAWFSSPGKKEIAFNGNMRA